MLQKRPFLPWAIALGLGIFIGFQFQVPTYYKIVIALFSVLTVPFSALIFRKKWFLGISTCLAIMGIGILLPQLHDERNQPDHISHGLDSLTEADFSQKGVVFRLTENPKERTTTYVGIAEVLLLKEGEKWHKNSGQIRVFFKRPEEGKLRYKAGDILITQASPKLISAPKNPYEFDQKTFYARKQVYHQVYIKPTEVFQIGHLKPSFFQLLAIKARAYTKETFEELISGKKEQAILSAMTLGIKDDLDYATRDAYANAGVVHILAVSGLHVGILLLLVNGLLWWTPILGRKGKYLKVVASLIILWTYALFTGFPASICRACLMFSLLQIALVFQRKTDIINLLALSAMLILLAAPEQLFDLGFQLSYSAIAGIMLLYPSINSWWKPSNKLLQWLWNIECMSLSAQFGVLPLSLYYFHLFPNFFIITNPPAILLATLILPSGLFLLIARQLPFIEYFGKVTEFLCQMLNLLVEWINQLPYAVSENIFINTTQTILLATIIISLGLLLHKKKAIYLKLAACMAILFGCSRFHTVYQWKKQNKLTIYYTKNTLVIDDFEGQFRTTYLTKSLNSFEENIQIKPNRIAHQALNVTTNFLDGSTNALPIIANGKSILVLQKQPMPTPKKVEVDILVLSGNTFFDYRHITESIDFKELVIPTSRPRYTYQKLENDSKNNGASIYIIGEQGAYVGK